MSNISLELGAKAILKTYHQVNDTSHGGQNGQNRIIHSKVLPKNREVELENELKELKEKYRDLQHQIGDRDERLARLNRRLEIESNHMARLQEDYENAIYQLTNRENS